MYCPKCGAYCADDDLFCIQCGAKISVPTPPPGVPTAVPVASPVVDVTPEPTPAEPFDAAEPVPEIIAPIYPAADLEPTPDYVSEPVVEPVVISANVPPVSVPVTEAVIPPQQPVWPDEQVPPETPPVKQRPKSSVLGKILSVVLSILIVIFAFGALTSYCVRQCLSKDVVRNAIEEFDLLSLPMGEDGTLLDVIQEGAAEAGYDITKKELREALENSTASDDLAAIIAGVGDYLTGKEANFEVKADEILGIIEENVEAIEDATDIRLSEEDIKIIEDYLNEEAGMLEDFNSDALIDVPGIDLLRSSFSLVAMIVMAAVVLVLIVLIFILNKRRYAGFAYSGIGILISGILVAMVSVLYTTLAGMVNVGELAMFFSEGLKSLIRSTFGLTGLAAIGLGIVLIVIYILCASASKRKYRKLATAELPVA